MSITKDAKPLEVEEKKVEMDTYYPHVKNVVRWVSKSGASVPEEGIWSVFEIDNYLDVLYQRGYRLHTAHYIGEAPGGYGILYVLVWNGAE